MKLSVDYPSVAFREGPDKVLELAKAIEEIGYDEIAVFDHVVMGYPTEDEIFAVNAKQMQAAKASKQALQQSDSAPSPITTAIVRTSTFMTIRHAAHLGSCADTSAGQAGSALVVSPRASLRMRR